jgi:hypothetical protein
MRDTIALELVDSHGRVRTSRCREVLALVWAVDDDQAAKAINHLHHALWPYWYLFQITEVRQLPPGGRCPLRQDDPAPLASALREQWMWVLIASEADSTALVEQTTDAVDPGRVAGDARGGGALPCT